MATNQRRSGAVMSYVSLAVNAVTGFLYVPLLLRFLTASEYGVYELIGSIIAYLGVMDMGLSTTLSRYYVKSSVTEEKKKTENLLSMSAFIYGVLTFGAVVVGVVLYFSLDSLFGNTFTVAELRLAYTMMLLVIVNCVIVLPGNWFLALINAEERFVYARTLSTIKYALQLICSWLILTVHASAISVLIVQVALNAIIVIAYVIYCKKNLHIKSHFHYWDWPLAKSMFGFSFFILLNMVFDQIFWKTGQFVLGATVGAVAVASYGMACKIITVGYMQLSTGLSSVFLPKLTKLSVTSSDMTEISSLFSRIGRLQAILIWAVCVGFAILGQAFVFLWAGPEFNDVYYATLILMFGLSISLVQNLGLSVLQAKNKMGFRSVVYVILAVLDVVVSIPVSQKFGVVGCAAAAAILLFIGTGPVVNWYYWKIIGIDIPKFFKEMRTLILPAIITGVISWLFSRYVFSSYSWAGLLLNVCVFLCIYATLLWFWGMNDYEKKLIKTGLVKLHILRVN